MKKKLAALFLTAVFAITNTALFVYADEEKTSGSAAESQSESVSSSDKTETKADAPSGDKAEAKDDKTSEDKTEVKDDKTNEDKTEVKDDKTSGDKTEVKDDKTSEDKTEVKDDKTSEDKTEVKDDKTSEDKTEVKDDKTSEDKTEVKDDKTSEDKTEVKDDKTSEDKTNVKDDKTDKDTKDDKTDKTEEKSDIRKHLDKIKDAIDAAKKDAKEYLKEIKAFFKEVGKDKRQEILNELAKIKEKLGDISIDTFVAGKNVDYSQYDNVLPVVENNRTLIPVRAVAETLGCDVGFNHDTNEITIVNDTTTIKMNIGSKTAVVNGEAIEMDAAPQIVNNRTLLPARFIAECFGYDVSWDSASLSVVIE